MHYADAEHALEKVTSGFRLALVYSICLPPKKRHLERATNKPLGEDLASVISSMGPDDKSFVLLLSHEYTQKSALDFGARVLKGVDRVRFGALEEANGIVAEDKKLVFFLAELTHKVSYAKSTQKLGWMEYARKQCTNWYTTDGENIGEVKKMNVAFNFLNPTHQSNSELWMPHGTKKDKRYTGNEGPTASTKYSRFAVVAWPVARHLENAVKFLPMDIAVDILSTHQPADSAALEEL